MAQDTLKSTSITNLDASPVIQNTMGEGAAGFMQKVSDFATTTSGVLLGSTYRLCRFPSTAKIKSVKFTCAALGGSTAFDIDIAHSDSTTDGTQPSLQGTIPQISSADNRLFGAAVSAATALTFSDVTFSGTFTNVHRNTPIWNVLVLLGVTTFTADPGGSFDILLKSTATNTSGGAVMIDVDFME